MIAVQSETQRGQTLGSIDVSFALAKLTSSEPGSVKSAHPRLQPRQPEQRIGKRRRNAGALAEFANGADQRVEFDRPAGLDILQHRGLEGAQLARDLVQSSGCWSIAMPMRAPISFASSITLEIKPRTRSSPMMRSDVAPVSALIGFTVILPQSLNQISF